MTSREFLQRSVYLGLAVLLLACIWLAALGFTVWRLRDEAVASGVQTAVTHVRNFEEHLTQTLQVIDLTAGGFEVAPSGKVDFADVGRRLDAALKPAPFLRSISLVDRDGRIVASSNPRNLGVRIGMSSFFPSANAESDVLRIGTPWRGRDLGSGVPSDGMRSIAANEATFIPVLRRLPAQNVSLWLVAALNPDYFATHGSQLLPLEEGRVQWLRYDGITLVSSSPRDAVAVPGAAGQVGALLAQREYGSLTQALPDGTEVLSAYRASSRFPALVAVHINRAKALEGWAHEARRLASIVIPVLFALGLVSWGVWLRQHRIAAQQAELEKEQQMAASVFASSADSIVITTPEAVILSVNPAFERMSGYSAAEVVGRNPRLLASGMQDKEFYRRMWETILEQGFWTGELVNRRKDGSHFTVQVSISAVKDSEGGILHYVGISTDIGARKRYEAELLEARYRAEAAALAKTYFLASMSHEIRTPMNGVLGMTELMLLGELSHEQREQLLTIKHSGDALLTILNDILDFSKIEAQGVSLESVSFDPVEVLNDLVGLYEPHATAKRLRLTEVIDKQMPHDVTGDPFRLRQVLGNLLSNAIKFTHTGEITVRAGLSRGAESGNCDEGTLCLQFDVVDTGIGIPLDKQAAIFDAFIQADSSTTRQYGGTGLGLAISRRLAEAMGGSLSVTSLPDQGSCFCLRIRVHADGRRKAASSLGDAERACTPADTTAADQRPLHILAAEDTPSNQLILRAMLTKFGHQVQLVTDGAQAVAAFKAARFDVVLMDLQMPVMGGLEAARAIREHEAMHGGHIPIIAVTANAFAQDREACLAAGMDDFLSKPIKLADLAGVLSRYSGSD